jgi:hypothetical protein
MQGMEYAMTDLVKRRWLQSNIGVEKIWVWKLSHHDLLRSGTRALVGAAGDVGVR